MTKRFQIGWLSGALICAASALCSVALAFAQDHPDRPPQRQQAPAPRASQPATRTNSGSQHANRPPANQTGRSAGNAAPRSTAPSSRSSTRIAQGQNSGNPSYDRAPGSEAGRTQPNYNPNRPPSSRSAPPPSNNFNSRPNENRPGGFSNNRPYEGGSSGSLRPRQEVGVGAPRPFVDRMRDLNPQQRDRVLQNSQAFQNLAPEQQSRIRQQFNQWDHLNAQQRTDLRAKEDTWRRMTPEQRSYVKNEVLPRWRQIPWERQQVIQQKLGILQNMPESARNRRLSDPNFTRGLSDEDRQTLHDLSHLHVGGAPDPPGNE